MSDHRDTSGPENPLCRCGHPKLRHVFGSGWCTVSSSHVPCRCSAFEQAPLGAVVEGGSVRYAARLGPPLDREGLPDRG